MLLTLHYDGSRFHGWQVQPDQRTVQGELQATLSRLTGAERVVLGSGRTDTGVHALGQVASVDVPAPRWSPAELRKALNATLPPDIWIESVRAAAPDFHPRYDASARSYAYRIGTDGSAASPFHRHTCWALGEPLDSALLAAGAARIHGRHSFEAFAKAGQPERGYDCTVQTAAWSPWELGTRFEITADRYLHHMVRYLVGTMVDVARRRRPLEDIDALLAGAPAVTTSPPAPAAGLFLTRVEYPATVLLSADEPSAATPRSTASA